VTLLAADDRAYLTVGRPARYALGDPAAPALILNAVDAAGCMWWAEVPEGWDAAELTTPLDRKGYGDGGYAGVPTYEPRTLTITGAVAAPDPETLDLAYRRLIAVVQGRRGPIRYTHLDETPQAMGLWCDPTGRPTWKAADPRVADFTFLLVAEDPIKTGSASLYGPIRLPTAQGEGGYPMGATGALMPWTSAAGPAALTVAAVRNQGDEPAHAVYRVTGPVPRPRIVLGTGEFVALDADLGALDTWTVDTTTGTSTVNGVNRYDAWAAGSTFPLIPASDPVAGTSGGTEVRLRSGAGGTDQAAGLTVTTAPSWK
jgi:hypothetical protein